jgi:chitodextrinase
VAEAAAKAGQLDAAKAAIDAAVAAAAKITDPTFTYESAYKAVAEAAAKAGQLDAAKAAIDAAVAAAKKITDPYWASMA